ncbi:glycosyltransferase family 2 protein [Lactiplantibacillus paraxiangfangensis]|uniref:glycosyltransferase family 2 protein n=1 Tax=Lactiplantibacillus paraxiangfangensis TaxID=3076224 RepID=UPI0030C6B6EE
MKYLTFAIPSYNSEDYLQRCVDSLLKGGDGVEILIIDDGSTDQTPAIADDYAAKYPNIVKAIHQKNAGHGGAVNNGLAHATGKYFKVVDSDDWLDEKALQSVLAHIKDWDKYGQNVDMLVCNYVYENYYQHKSFVVNYRHVFPNDQICGWDDTKRFGVTQYLIMHSLIFKTAILRRSGVKLPEHTFYVDNLFADQPLPLVHKICYLDLDLYRYFIGRADQSINEDVMISRIDQQIRVTKLVADCTQHNDNPSSKLRTYLDRSVSVMLAVSSVHLLLMGTDEALAKRHAMWQYVKKVDKQLYWRLRLHSVSAWTYLPTRLGRFLTVTGYRASRLLVKFQ